MYKFEFPTEELELIKSKITFSDLQLRIIEYRDKDMSIIQIAMKENISESSVSRQIRKIVNKMKKVI